MIKLLRPRLKPARQTIALAHQKRADAYYFSPEHKAWRAVVIARAGGVCQWPECGRKEPRMFADHIIERKDGGSALDPANGQCLCGKHHSIKTALERARRLRQPIMPGGSPIRVEAGGAKVEKQSPQQPRPRGM